MKNGIKNYLVGVLSTSDLNELVIPNNTIHPPAPTLDMIWCNIHQRPYQRCLNREGGIMLPCQTVDLEGILEIEYTR